MGVHSSYWKFVLLYLVNYVYPKWIHHSSYEITSPCAGCLPILVLLPAAACLQLSQCLAAVKLLCHCHVTLLFRHCLAYVILLDLPLSWCFSIAMLLSHCHSALPLSWTQCVSPISHVAPHFPFVSFYDMQPEPQTRKERSPLAEQSFGVHSICVHLIVSSCSFWVMRDEWEEERKKINKIEIFMFGFLNLE